MGFAHVHKPASNRAPAARLQADAARTAVPPRRHIPFHDVSRVPVADTVHAAPAARGATGLPDGLRAGMEALTGLSMDAIQVHYASSEPARIDAHAFTRGTDIHLAPGQEEHLPHEAWHVVQQAKGRVKPTLDVGGRAINDDPVLEREADRMGEASAKRGRSLGASPHIPATSIAPMSMSSNATTQRVLKIAAGDRKGTYNTAGGMATKQLIKDTDLAIGDDLKAGWKGYVGGLADKNAPLKTFSTTDAYYDDLRAKYEVVAKSGGKTRPNFSTAAYDLARITYGIQTGVDQSGLKPSEEDLAMPHRFPYSAIEKSVALYITDKEKDVDLERWTDRLYDATVEREKINLKSISSSDRSWYIKKVQEQLTELKNAVTAIKLAKASGTAMDLHTPVVQRLLKAANNMHGNIPDYGPHTTVNIPVSNRLHVHVEKPDDWDEDDDDMQAPMTPGSSYAVQMSPHRVDKGIAYDDDGEYVVGTDGFRYDPSRILDFDEVMDDHVMGKTTIDQQNLDHW